MNLTNQQTERIAHSVIKVLYSRFNSFPQPGGNNRNAPFHTAFLRAFHGVLDGRVQDIPDFINLSSWMHGLNTTLGQSFFESVAHILCEGEKRDFRNKEIYTDQMNIISNIMTDLKNGDRNPSLQNENDLLQQSGRGKIQNAPNFTVDCFYETNTDVVAFELKSVRPNSGEMRGEKQKILIGRAVLRKLYPNKRVNYLFGFPFDPTAENSIGYDKRRFLNYLVEAEKFVAEDDFLIADEFWSFLASSNNAMSDILDIINRIATPDFMNIFERIQDTNTAPEQKLPLLSNWFLNTEVEIINERERLSRLNTRLFNQTIFKTDGSYNIDRIRLVNNN